MYCVRTVCKAWTDSLSGHDKHMHASGIDIVVYYRLHV